MTAEPAPPAPDAHTTRGKIDDLLHRYDEAVHAGSARAVQRQHARGKKTARERIDALLDEGSFVELDEFARHRSTNFGQERTRPYGDGVVTGYGTVDGRGVCVFSQDVTFEDLGGARTHNTKSGVAHHMAADEDAAISYVKELLSYLPSNNLDVPPAWPSTVDPEPDPTLDAIIPDSANQPYDMHEVLSRVLDDGEFCEVHELFAPNIVVGFGRIEGAPVGVVANQPLHFAGCLDIDASEKAARFVRTCDAFNIPVLTFVDVPGFLPGTSQEWEGIIRRGAKLLYAYGEATVPKITVITRKAYGGAYDVMGSKHLGADLNFAWPTAQIAVMGAQGAANIVHRKRLAAAKDAGEDVDALRATLITEYEDTLANPYVAAERGYVDSVIPPSATRVQLARALRTLRSKRETLPPKKHGNIPL